jgi:hypothetical protein
MRSTDEWLRVQINDAARRVKSWGDTHNPNYWFDKGRLEAYIEMRTHLRMEQSAEAKPGLQGPLAETVKESKK